MCWNLESVVRAGVRVGVIRLDGYCCWAWPLAGAVPAWPASEVALPARLRPNICFSVAVRLSWPCGDGWAGGGRGLVTPFGGCVAGNEEECCNVSRAGLGGAGEALFGALESFSSSAVIDMPAVWACPGAGETGFLSGGRCEVDMTGSEVVCVSVGLDVEGSTALTGPPSSAVGVPQRLEGRVRAWYVCTSIGLPFQEFR